MKLCLHEVGTNFYYSWLRKVDPSKSSVSSIDTTNIAQMRRLIDSRCDYRKQILIF